MHSYAYTYRDDIERGPRLFGIVFTDYKPSSLSPTTAAILASLFILPYLFVADIKGDFFGFFLFMYNIQHCFICRPSDSTVSKNAEIEPRTVATTALAVRRSNHSARSHPHSARSHPHSARFHPQLC
jgi:hypothetical protein